MGHFPYIEPIPAHIVHHIYKLTASITMLLPLLLLSVSPWCLCSSLRGSHVTISVNPESKPHLMLKEGHENIIGNAKYEGLLVDLITELSINLGFTYTLEPVADGKYGQRNEDGSWSGMIGAVNHGDADMALADMTITSNCQGWTLLWRIHHGLLPAFSNCGEWENMAQDGERWRDGIKQSERCQQRTGGGGRVCSHHGVRQCGLLCGQEL